MLLLGHAMQQRVKQIQKSPFCLTLLLDDLFFRRFLRYSLRQALIVYRLIDAALIGNFSDHPFLF